MIGVGSGSWLQVLVNSGIRLVLMVGVYLWYGLPLTTSLLLAPLGIIALLGFGMTLSLLLTPLSLLYNDVQQMLGMALTLWFFFICTRFAQKGPSKLH